MSAYRALSLQRRKFVDAYLEVCDDGEAAQRSGYRGKRPRDTGWGLRQRADVKAALAERAEEMIERSGISKLRVLEVVASVAMADVADLYDHTTRKPCHPLDIPPRMRRAIGAIRFDKDGNVLEYRLRPSEGAQRMLMQYLKLIGFDPTVPLLPPVEGEATDLERARRIAYLLEAGLRATRQGQPALTNGHTDPSAQAAG